MACKHCAEFTRSHLVRQAVAEAGRGLPAIEPGMPTPAGTGLSRRSFLLRSSAAVLSVYGASKLKLGELEEGIARAAGSNERVLVSIFLDGGVDSLSVLAPTTDPIYRRLRPSLALPPDAGTAFGEDPRLRWNPAAGAFADLHAAGKMSVLPAIGYASPDQSHFTSRHYWEVGALLPNEVERLDGPAARHDRHRRQPASGPVARRLAVAGAGQPLGAGRGDRRSLVRPLGRGRLG